MDKVLLSALPIQDLENLVGRVVQRELSAILKAVPAPTPDELVTRKQAAKYLGLSLPTLHDYTQRGIVTAYRLGSRVRYRKAELSNALLKVQAAKYQTA